MGAHAACSFEERSGCAGRSPPPTPSSRQAVPAEGLDEEAALIPEDPVVRSAPDLPVRFPVAGPCLLGERLAVLPLVVVAVPPERSGPSPTTRSRDTSQPSRDAPWKATAASQPSPSVSPRQASNGHRGEPVADVGDQRSVPPGRSRIVRPPSMFGSSSGPPTLDPSGPPWSRTRLIVVQKSRTKSQLRTWLPSSP